MDGGPHPAVFLLQRFILGPSCALFAGFGVWALVERHWLTGTLLLTACFFGVAIGYGLSAGGNDVPAAGEASGPDEDETEPDDARPLARGIIRANILFSLLLMGLVWSERLPLIRSAVFVVLFSILFPAAAALFCLVGEQMMARSRDGQRRIHRGPPRHPGITGAH